MRKKVTIILYEQNDFQTVNVIFVGKFDREKIEKVKATFDETEVSDYAFYFTKKLQKRGEDFVRWLIDFVESEIFKKENTVKIENKIWEEGKLKRWEVDLWQTSDF